MMTTRDQIMTYFRANGRATARQIIEDTGLDDSHVYAELKGMFIKGIVDRRLRFIQGYKGPVYQYWLAEDPQGIE